jgi:hypothetical protein
MSESTPTEGSTTRETVTADRVDDAEAEPVETVAFTLDGRQVTGRKGEMLIAAAERAGTFIPRFCYHPRMKSVGVCRMCLVEVSGPRGASLQPSCYVEVQAGSEVTTTSDKVKKAQDGVLEFLLVNHPLDCPVCDKGGECPLQDQTLAYGPGESRFVGASSAAGAPASPTRSPAKPRSTSSVGASSSRSTRSPSCPSRRTSRATPCRSARSGHSLRPRTGSRPGPGIWTRSSRHAPPARWAAGLRCSRHPTG